MTILEVNFSPALGGLELYCLNTSRQLQKRGHRILLWLAQDSRMAKHPLAAELEVTLFPEPWYFNPFFSKHAARLLVQQPVEVMHLHRSRDLAALSWIKQPPRVLTLQIESTLRKKDLFHRFVYARVDRILTITERMRGFVLDALPVQAEQVFTLPYGIDTNFTTLATQNYKFRSQHLIPAEAFLIGIVGRLEEPKGQAVLLNAFAKIAQNHPNVHLLIAGESPPEHLGFDLKLKSLAQRLGVSPRVHFTGFVADTHPVYAALDVCVLASQEETFGLVLLEAMAAGVPIVATNAGGVPEIITHHVNGLLVLPGDSEALAAALLLLNEDEALRQELSLNGRKVVAEKYDIERHLTSLEAHFAAVIACKERS